MSRRRLFWSLGIAVIFSGPVVVTLHEGAHALVALATGGAVVEVYARFDHGAVAFRSPAPGLVYAAGPLGAVVAASALSCLSPLRVPGCVFVLRAALEATAACVGGSAASDPAQAAAAAGVPQPVLAVSLLVTVWAIVGSTLGWHLRAWRAG